MTEFDTVAVILLVASALALGSALMSRVGSKLGIPVVVVFLAIGMLAGSEGIGRIAFEDYTATFRIATIALVFILFDGGLNTSMSTVRKRFAPAVLLSTLGVALTMLLVALGAHLFGFRWQSALLLGAIVSSTDAAAVFSVLRGGGVSVHERVGSTVELESGMNDPAAVLLTTTLASAFVSGGSLGWGTVALALLQFAVGAAIGLAVSWLGRRLLARFRPTASGLYPLLTTSVAGLAFAVASLLYGSGILAVYVAGIVLGNVRLPYRGGVLRIHDFLAWTGQVVLFVMLGLLVTPSRLVGVAGEGLGIAAFLCFVARPLVVAVFLLPFRFSLREIVLISWAGLKGAVPVVLALVPVLSGTPGAMRIFDVVFFVVVVSAVLQGSTVRWLTRRLGLGGDAPPARPATLEIVSMRTLANDMLAFDVASASLVCGTRIADIPFPEGSAAMLVVRGDELVAARGNVVLEEGDQVYIFCRREDAGFFQLLFGAPKT